MTDSEVSFSTRIDNLESQFSELKSILERLNSQVKGSNRMLVWQLVIFALVMVGTLVGTMYWAEGVLNPKN